ncbi:MAG TPA: NfeD family protein [Acidimicrobiales bacterium]|nr:NfeD family protein [Acidimicrobiales bacterium]
MRRLVTVLLALFVLTIEPAASQTPPKRHVDVLQVSGLIDPVVHDAINDALRGAERGQAVALLLQLNSSGGVVPRGQLDQVKARLARSTVPVAVWVGPVGAKAYGQAFELLQAAPIKGVSPGSKVGGDKAHALDDESALDQRLADISAPTIGDFLVQLDDHGLDTAKVVQRGGQPRREITVRVRNAKPGLLALLLHTAASPSVAFLLLVMGLALVILEFYTAGIGVAAVTGAGCLVLSAYGLGVLPTRPWAVALVALGMFGYAVDLQAGTPRTWTVIGTLSLAFGSVNLYGHGLRASWLTLAAVVAGVALFMVAGMPAMVRARFSTPTIGRESMVGELGSALAAVDPEGTVEVRGAPWRARTNRATPIQPGEAVRVVAIDGLLLEVEPESGGAKDYRR